MTDNIFGNLIELENRLARHHDNLTGVKHLHRRDPLDPIPGQPILITLTTGGPAPYDTARCLFTVDGSRPDPDTSSVMDLHISGSVWDDPTLGIVLTWSGELPPQPAGTLIRYLLVARRADTGAWVYADTDSQDVSRATAFALWVDHDPVPEWVQRAIVYQIFPERFHPGNDKAWKPALDLNDFHGGTLRGVIDKLDYIQSIGFNAIWINPFFKTSSHHGYNASDYYNVEPRLGTNADLRELLDEAHARGFRMILDFVANHWSKDHPTFQEASRDKNSPFHDWYFWKHWPEDYECYFNVRELPKINLQHGPAREYMLDVARHWLREGFDGYRLDFAYGPSHDFWVDFRRACREVKPDCWIFGEVVHTPAMLRSYTGIMDGTLDFPLASLMRETFAFEQMSLTEFEARLSGLENFYPPDHCRPSFLDNHDEARFLHIAGDNKDKLKLASLVLFALIGPPIVYCGTETGLSQIRPMRQGNRNVFEEARLPMNWETADSQLIDYFTRLVNLRKSYPALWHGPRSLLHLDETSGTYAFLRSGDAGKKIIVAANRSPRARKLSLPCSGMNPSADLLNHNPIEVHGGMLTIDLPPYSGAFIPA